ncbi:hypothetical protein Taro_008139 [Colocasia esculenta]|uniref:Uncharacterized protein n=1 Tax=Colocasia esculenta TaxID=4460 RepID=A0A843U084_COLES|nr:hypothetical protein [Colocasia esculenta]
MGTTTTAPSPPLDVRPAVAEKSHLEKEGMSFATEAHPTPGLSKRFWGPKERGSEKRTSWTVPGRTPKMTSASQTNHKSSANDSTPLS